MTGSALNAIQRLLDSARKAQVQLRREDGPVCEMLGDDLRKAIAETEVALSGSVAPTGPYYVEQDEMIAPWHVVWMQRPSDSERSRVAQFIFEREAVAVANALNSVAGVSGPETPK